MSLKNKVIIDTVSFGNDNHVMMQPDVETSELDFPY